VCGTVSSCRDSLSGRFLQGELGLHPHQKRQGFAVKASAQSHANFTVADTMPYVRLSSTEFPNLPRDSHEAIVFTHAYAQHSLVRLRCDADDSGVT
jgi:hypothetical protein